MLIFVSPGFKASAAAPPRTVAVRGLEGLIEAAYSKLPEHSSARTQVVDLNLRAFALARQLQAALPESLHEFWEAYSGWFAMYSIGPLLGNRVVGQQALAEHPTRESLVREKWWDAGWWSGRGMLHPALLDDLDAAGVRTRVQPGTVWQSLRGPVARMMAARAGAKALVSERQLAAQAGSPDVEPTRVLWLSLGASSTDLLAHLVPALAERHGLAQQILDFHCYGSEKALARRGLPFTNVEDFSGPEALAAGEQVQRALPRWWPEIRERALALPVHQELPPRLYAAIVDRLQIVLLRDAASWVVKSHLAHAALAAYRPQVVVATHVYGPQIAPMLIAATRAGLARVCLQHGVIGPRYLALPTLPYDEQLLFGDYPATIMRQICPPQTRVTVTGHCLYDLAETPPQPRPEVLALKERARGLVVLCTQFNEQMYYKPQGWWLAGVADACRKLGARLALKLHPSESEENLRLYQTLVRAGDDQVLLAPHGQWPLAELLAACDLMITRDSTVVFEANLLGKPALTINLSHWDEELPYAATGGAQGVYRFEDIEPAIDSLLNDEAARQELAGRREEFLSAQTGPRDGQATARITDAIAAWTQPQRD